MALPEDCESCWSLPDYTLEGLIPKNVKKYLLVISNIRVYSQIINFSSIQKCPLEVIILLIFGPELAVAGIRVTACAGHVMCGLFFIV